MTYDIAELRHERISGDDLKFSEQLFKMTSLYDTSDLPCQGKYHFLQENFRLPYSLVPNCRRVKLNTPREKLSRFLKMRGGGIFSSFSYNNQMNLRIRPLPLYN